MDKEGLWGLDLRVTFLPKWANGFSVIDKIFENW